MDFEPSRHLYRQGQYEVFDGRAGVIRGARRTPVPRRRSYCGADGGVRTPILARSYVLGV
jgi:hypothetical protein